MSIPAPAGDSPPEASKYRRDLDGLRAIAVLAVVALHVGLLPAPGGVDVFFILSGFLISAHLCRTLERRNFELLDFYARRVRRIFPPLILVFCAVFLLGWLTLLPDEFQLQGKYIVAAAGFFLNFAAYQDVSANSTPMTLHLWSLSVEEQFYLFWPLFLYVTWKLRGAGRLFAPIAAVAIVTYVIFCVTDLWDPNAAFLMPWCRVSEFAFGAAAALARMEKPPWSRWVDRLRCMRPGLWPLSAHIQGALGAILLVAWFGGLNRIYGWTILVPCVGTILLVTADPKGWTNQHILSNRVLVFVGRLSYPLYLWHLPLLVVAYTVSNSVQARFVAVTISILLAIVTYKYLEVPLRSPGATRHIRPLAVALTALMGIFGWLGYATFTGAIPSRALPPEIAQAFDTMSEKPDAVRRLSATSYAPRRGSQPGTDGAPRVLFVGDSSIEQYQTRVSKLVRDYPGTARHAVFATGENCVPGAAELMAIGYASRTRCTRLMQLAVECAADPSIKSIVVGASWQRHLAGKPATDMAWRGLAEMLREIANTGKPVYVILNLPVTAEMAPRRMIQRTILGSGFRLANDAVHKSHVLSQIGPLNSIIREIAEHSGAIVVDPVEWLCGEVVCPAITSSNQPVYRDQWQMNSYYIREQVSFLDDILLSRGPDGVEPTSTLGPSLTR